MKTKLASLLVGLLAGLGASSYAQTLEATFIDINPGQVVTGSFDGGFSFLSYSSGLFHFDKGNGFCVEPHQYIYAGETVLYTFQNPATLKEEAAISRIVGGYYASAQTALDAAAAQWAIWEVLQDGSAAPSFATGKTQLLVPTSAVGTRAMNYLTHLSSLPAAELVYLVNPCRQDMIAVPEPTAALLGGIGTLLLLIRRRR